jgi:hypothetical protein
MRSWTECMTNGRLVEFHWKKTNCCGGLSWSINDWTLWSPCPLKETWCGGHAQHVPVGDRHPDSNPHTAGLAQLRGRQTTGLASRSRPKDQAVGNTGRTCPDCDCHNLESLRQANIERRRRRRSINGYIHCQSGFGSVRLVHGEVTLIVL